MTIHLPIRGSLTFLSLLIAAGFALFSTRQALAIQSDNLQLIAVPAQGKVAIDAKLDDWDLSGTILSCPDTSSAMDTYAVRSAAMYDGDGLYFAFRWTDATPMMNAIDPDEPGMSNQGWKSDCLQLRILTDTQVHVTAWQYQPTGKMKVDINYDQAVGENRVSGLEHGAKMALSKNADGKGYVQELFIPWTLLSKSKKVYKAGESFTLGLHFNWGGGDNRSARAMEWTDVVSGPNADRNSFYRAPTSWGKISFSASGHVKLSPQPWEKVQSQLPPDLETVGPMEIKYDLPAAGATTIVIEDQTGRRVRNLISGFPRKAGANLDYWDGLDERGKSAPAGSYTWHGIINPGLDVRYKAHLFPHTNPPWRNAAGTGGWGADHSIPQYVCVSKDRVFLLYGVAEGGSALVCCDLQGNKIWGQGGAFQGGGAVCAVDDKYVYFADNTISRSEITRIDAATGKAALFAGGLQTVPTGLSNDAQLSQLPTGMAIRGDQLFLACARRNAILIFDLKTVKAIKELSVPSPYGLAIDTDGRLLVATGTAPESSSVIVMNVDSGATTPLIAQGLRAPRGISVGPAGQIYVVNSGTQQLFVYSKDGKTRIREIGTPGGRAPVGKWDRDGMLNPTSVGLDKDGNAWVCEADPVAKRLSRWSEAGHNTGEWLGPTPYGGDGIVDHNDRTRIYTGGLEFKLDWATGESYPVWTHLRGPEQGQPVSAALCATGTFWHRQGRSIAFKGHNYLCYDRGLICIARGDAWVPAAAIGFVKGQDASDCLLWSDRNEDGKVQPDEVVQPPLGFNPQGAGQWGIPWSEDLTTVRHVSEKKVCQIAPAEFTKGGVPIFDGRSFSAPIPLPVNGYPVTTAGDSMVAFYEDSHVKETMKAYRENPLGDLTGIKGYDLKGKLRWTYPQPFSGVHGSFKAPLPTTPGEVIGTLYVMGVADMGEKIGRIICFNGYYGQRFLFTSDGLYVGSIFKDGRTNSQLPEKATKDMLLNDASAGGEAYGGTFDRNQNGEVYLTGGFYGPMVVVMSVEGLDHLQRIPGGTIELTSDLAAKGLEMRRSHDASRLAQSTAGPVPIHIARLTPTVDGDLGEWNLKEKGTQIQPDARRNARVGLAYDDRFLYAAFDVTDPSPWSNAGTDEKTMFINGDSVDIQLGSMTDAAQNMRISIAPQQGKPVVMLYQPTVAGFKGKRVPFVSPVGHEEMDRVERIDSANVIVRKREGGYVLEAAIPLSALPLTIKSGVTLRGDLGVLFSDNLGAKCVLRAYVSNKDTNMTSDLPTEARLQPGQWTEISAD